MFDRKLHFLRHLDGVLKIEKIMALDIVKFKERIFFSTLKNIAHLVIKYLEVDMGTKAHSLILRKIVWILKSFY